MPDMKDYRDIVANTGLLLRKARRQRRMSQRSVAEGLRRAGVSYSDSMISLVEQGHLVRLDVFLALCDVLKVRRNTVLDQAQAAAMVRHR